MYYVIYLCIYRLYRLRSWVSPKTVLVAIVEIIMSSCIVVSVIVIVTLLMETIFDVRCLSIGTVLGKILTVLHGPISKALI